MPAIFRKPPDLQRRAFCTSWAGGGSADDSISQFPRSELYGLTSQLRKAAVSIPSNIAEGKAIGGQSYPRHVKIALGSQAELETQIELACRLKMLTETDAVELLEQASEVGRMLVGLLNALPKT